MNKKVFFVITCAVLLLFVDSASAHTGLLESTGFGDGLLHPFLGLDHFLVIMGLGLWLSGQNLSERIKGVSGFLLFMVIGAGLALSGIHFAYVESLILVSMVFTGLLLMMSVFKAPPVSAMALIALIAFMHGQAHGNEMLLDHSVVLYISGFVLATLLLQSLGLFLGVCVQRYQLANLSRWYGSLTSLAGIWLLLNA